MPDSKKTLYLLDAMALAYRAHFVFISRPLINSKGFNTSATYGFTSALVKLIEDHGINHVAVVFDVMGEGGTFRDEMYEEYKAHRDPPPEELIANLPYIKQVVEAMDIPVVEVEGVEADDVIGTLAKQVERDGFEVVIVSPDKDFMQLLSPHVSMFRPAYRGEGFDPVTQETFRAKYDLEPEQFIDILALMGDSADNVPGVRGIGEKTAIKLISEYGSVENLLDHASEVKGKRAQEGLANEADMALLSKKLVTIKTDVELDLGWDDFACKSPDLGEIKQLFKDLEFSRLFDRVYRVLGSRSASEGEVVSSKSEEVGPTEDVQGSLFATSNVERYDDEQTNYHLISTLDGVHKLVTKLEAASRISFDTETTSVDAQIASLVGISFCVEPGEAYYISTPMLDGTSTEDALDCLRSVLESDIPKVGQNIKYDYLVLARHGVIVGGPLFDTMVAHYLVAPEEAHGLDAIALNYLNYETISISSLIGSGKNQISMREVPPADVAPYASEDADIALRLAHLFEPMLAEKGVESLARDIEFPLVRVLSEMELKGIGLNREMLMTLSSQTAEDLELLERQIFDVAGEEFNIASPAQIGVILFEKLKFPVTTKTSTGKPSTKESVLQVLATEHELPGLILDWRELAKLKSTYIDTLGELVHPETNRLHTSYSQTTAATGRLASSSPNLQNIPIRTQRGREIRKAFVPATGFLLLSADYAQIELRILASLADDDGLKKAYNEGLDIHTATAAKVFGVEPGEVTREQRSKAKEVNYGIPYGISAFGLSTRLRCSRGEAQELIDGYNKSFPAVAGYILQQIEKAGETGYAETMLGRRRYIPDIHARNRNVRAFAERVAVNMPIQGTQADMIKLAMIAIQHRIKASNLKSSMLLQVHDELVFEVHPDEIEDLKKLVAEEMIGALPLTVPIEISMDTGDNWLEAH